MSEQLVCTTDYKKKRGKLYIIDLDGDLCEGVMCGMIGRDEKGKPIYASPDKVLELDIPKEKGYLYFIIKAFKYGILDRSGKIVLNNSLL